MNDKCTCYIGRLLQADVNDLLRNMESASDPDDLTNATNDLLRVVRGYKYHLFAYDNEAAYKLACDIIDFLRDLDPFGFECDDFRDAQDIADSLAEGVPVWFEDVINDVKEDPETLKEAEELARRIREEVAR